MVIKGILTLSNVHLQAYIQIHHCENSLKTDKKYKNVSLSIYHLKGKQKIVYNNISGAPVVWGILDLIA